MLQRSILSRLIQAAIAYAVVWLVCFVESMICETAWGGPFTILVSFILKFVFAGFAVVVALVIGILMLITGVRAVWMRVGYWSLLLSAAALAVVVFASRLGLRTIDPASNYRLLPFWIWFLCLVGIGFPIANLPARRVGNAPNSLNK